MNSLTADHAARLRDTNDSAAHPASIPLLVLLALCLGFVLTFNGVVAVWQTGVIHDPDDAMRLVQVRELLVGQSWFDMSVYRLDPPGGSAMHWSRVVDIPLALLIKGFGLFVPAEAAERLARLAFPLLLQAALYVAVARLAKSLLGREAMMPAIFMVLLSGIAFGQFQPGRIDHHAPQIVLLAFMLGGLVEAVRSQRMMPAAVAGGLAALSLAISLENLPFILTLWALYAGFWIWLGRSMRRVMKGFAIGLLIGLPLCFVSTVGPSHWFLSVPDAFSFGQLLGGIAGALMCFGLAHVPKRFDHRLGRFGLACAGAMLVLGLVAIAGRQSLRGPFADVDPLIHAIWLSNVHEVWTFLRFMQKEPASAAILMVPLALASGACAVAIFYETGARRLQWVLVAGVCLTGIAMSLWLIRVMTSVGPIAPLGAVWTAMLLNRNLTRANWRSAPLWSYLLLLPFAPVAWALAVGGDEPQGKNVAENCREPAAFTSLAALPPGLILAPIDAGSHILAFTPHSILAAPYHRNNHGNKVALDAFLALPDDARAIVIASGVAYVAVCPGLGETAVLGERSQGSLAQDLVNGHIPDWLVPVSAANTPYKIFSVHP